jgi:hypothetical protein
MHGDTHRYLYKKSTDQVLSFLDTLTSLDNKRVFVSHFPIVEVKSYEAIWAGDLNLGRYIQEEYKINY